ncbi:MAG: hypothetical protein WCC58_11800 [Burkholderiales bacterium]
MVFAVGFVLGVIRTLWMVPGLGARTAELIEIPFMLAAVFIIARWLVQRHVQSALSRWLVVGLLALAFMLATEFTLVLALRGLTINEYFASRDPVSGTAYSLSLLLFACAPFFISLWRQAAGENQ